MESAPSSADEILEKFQTSHEGLTESEAASRLAKYGPNALAVEKAHPLRKLFSYFWGPIPWMIEIAAILSLISHDYADTAIILVLLLFNAGIGFWEESKASDALDALKAQLALTARVLREGKWAQIDASKLVPGDVIRVRLGDVVPADAVALAGDYLSVDQSSLTGESLPVTKKTGATLYSGSAVKQGEMLSVVSETGANTFFAKTAKLVESAGAVSHFQKAVLSIGNFLIILAGLLCVFLVVVLLSRGEDPLQILQFVLVLAVASIPVAMPAVLSVTMALGALTLSKHKAIVSKLQSIEEMAGIDILCSDKTGTLTQNKLTLGDPVLFAARDKAELVEAAALASKAEDQDPIDTAIIAAVEDRDDLKAYKLLHFTPFDPISKKASAETERDGRKQTFAKGAPQVIIDLCKPDPGSKSKAEEAVNQCAEKGFRTLGVARSDGGGNWTFLGLLSLYDPPREDSKETIAAARKQGISVKMVTGDNAAVAKEIAGELDLGTNIIPASRAFPKDLDPDRVPPDLAESIEKAEGFAEVFPEHKYAIVRALQSRGHLVGMTGDGVNDAPALKQADVGVAVSGATDAARGAAALILTQPGLSTIVRAVELARQIFVRMLSYSTYRIAMTIDIMFFVVLAMLMIPSIGGVSFHPLTPIMIILLALLDDIPIMTIAYDNVRAGRKPVQWNMGQVILLAGTLGALSVLQTFGLLCYGHFQMNLDAAHLQTVIFLQLVAGGHLLLFIVRTSEPFWKPPFPAAILFWAIMGTQVLAALLCGFGILVPAIPWYLIGIVWLYNIVWMFILDFVKLMVTRVEKLPRHHTHLFHGVFSRFHQALTPFRK